MTLRIIEVLYFETKKAEAHDFETKKAEAHEGRFGLSLNF